MGKRYRLKGTDIEADVLEMGSFGVPPGMTWLNLHGLRMATFRENLEEIPPPTPEPEPGAYLIGGVLCVRFRVMPGEDEWVWQDFFMNGDPGWSAGTFARVWELHGGGDTDIVPLVPKPAAVELPWEGGSGNTEVTGDAEERQLAAEIAETQARDVDRATALSQARTRVVEAARLIAESVRRAEAIVGYPMRSQTWRAELLAAVDALEEVERRG